MRAPRSVISATATGSVPAARRRPRACTRRLPSCRLRRTGSPRRRAPRKRGCKSRRPACRRRWRSRHRRRRTRPAAGRGCVSLTSSRPPSALVALGHFCQAINIGRPACGRERHGYSKRVVKENRKYRYHADFVAARHGQMRPNPRSA
jgi:hypothetical protein